MLSRWQPILAVVIMVCMATSLEAANLAGSYTCQGVNPNGPSYSGTVKIIPSGDAYLLNWTIQGTTHTGVGIVTGNYLSSSWSSGGPGGIVVYRIESDGRLVGTWANPSGGALGTETLTPQ